MQENSLTIQDFQKGHRERIKEKFLKSEGVDFLDYELLELLLTFSIPRKDVKPLAKTLLSKFGSLGNVLGAPIEDLLKIKGIKEHSAILIKLTATLNKSILKREIIHKHILTNWESVANYCHSLLGRETKEQVYIIPLDASNAVIDAVLIQKGSVCETPVYVREVIENLIKCRAVSFILVHNHPSGNTKASNEDKQMTALLYEATKQVGIKMQDHFIVSSKGINSFKLMGLMDSIEKNVK